MPGIQLETKSSPAIVNQGIADCKKSLKTFHELCRSSLGPRGKIKFVQNCVGGNLTVTSTATRLFSSMSIHTPILQVLTSTLQSQVGTYGDGGMFYASLASGLVLKVLESGIRLKIISEIFETLLTISLDFVNSKACMYRYPVNFADVNFMSLFVRSILDSKPLCRLNIEEKKHLTALVLECFLNSVAESDDCAPSDNVYVTTDHAENVTSSQTFRGMLLVTPELSKYKPIPLKLHRVKNDGSDAIKVALISASLSGDLEEVGDVRLRMEGDRDMDSLLLDHLAGVCTGLMEAGVGVVLAQRVVHPHLQRQLQASNILVLHRIGLQPLGYLAKLTGATPISCLDTAIPEVQYGRLDDIQHTIINNKSYVHLVKGDNPVNTLMLTHQQEQPLCEIKAVITAALAGLDQLLQHPYVLCGGGCWQGGLVTHIRQQVSADGGVLADKLEVSRMTLAEACHLFTEAILDSTVQPGQQPYYNTRNGHLFYSAGDSGSLPGRLGTTETRCGCGMMSLDHSDDLTELTRGSRDDLDKYSTGIPHVTCVADKTAGVWDSMSVRLNALKVAVLSASAVLRIGQVMNTG